jgi:hypothetical protein
VRIPVLGVPGKELNVDVLHKLYDSGGLRKSSELTRRVLARALVVQFDEAIEIRVMHPLDVLASRVQNAAGLLDSKGPHVLTQAMWAVKVAREAILRVARSPQSAERPGALAQEVLSLAMSSAGRRLYDEHDIDVAASVPIDELETLVPGFRRQAQAIRETLQKRPLRAAQEHDSDVRQGTDPPSHR